MTELNVDKIRVMIANQTLQGVDEGLINKAFKQIEDDSCVAYNLTKIIQKSDAVNLVANAIEVIRLNANLKNPDAIEPILASAAALVMLGYRIREIQDATQTNKRAN